jgi:hypothetical protein
MADAKGWGCEAGRLRVVFGESTVSVWDNTQSRFKWLRREISHCVSCHNFLTDRENGLLGKGGGQWREGERIF